jgi:hypothetical protein
MSISLHARDALAAKVHANLYLFGARFDLRDIPIVNPILPDFLGVGTPSNYDWPPRLRQG